MPRTSEYVRTFKVKKGDNKLMPFRIDDKNYWKNIKLFGLKLKIALNALPVYDNRYIKTKIRT